jgi:type IV secretory pathway VirB2 component (pilin)
MLRKLCDTKFISYIILATLLSTTNFKISLAAGYQQQCQQNGGSNPTGLDGSDCDVGMICDAEFSICTMPTEVPCKPRTKGSSCPVGMACVDANGKILQFTGANANTFGTCQPYQGASTEDNAISQVLCNVYNFATGKTGRIIIGIIFVGAGATFLLGSMRLGTCLLYTSPSPRDH